MRTGTSLNRRRLGAILASAMLHLVALAALGVRPPLPRYPLAPDGPTVTLSLIRPPPSAAAAPALQSLALKLRPAARPLQPGLPPQPLVPLLSPDPAAPAAPSPAVVAEDQLQFYRKQVPGCAKEDLILLPAEQQAACRLRMAAAAAAERKTMQAGNRDQAGFSIIDPAKRGQYQAALEARRNKAPESQAVLAALAKERGGAGVNTNIDVNVRFKCSAAFGAGADGIRFGKLNCPTGRPK